MMESHIAGIYRDVLKKKWQIAIERDTKNSSGERDIIIITFPRVNSIMFWTGTNRTSVIHEESSTGRADVYHLY